MASDSREGSAPVELPPELEAWLTERADALGLAREDVLVQLVSAYRAAAELDGEGDPAALVGADVAEALDLEGMIAAAADGSDDDPLEAPVAEAVERELAARLGGEVEAAIEEHLPTITDAVEGRLEDRETDPIEERGTERLEGSIDDLETEFQEKIVDVRERVIQVKNEADGKAPADHDHEAFERVDAIDERLQDLAETVEELADSLEAIRADADECLEDLAEAPADEAAVTDALEERLDDAEDKLKRVAWVVSDLKDDTGGRSAHEQALARIKRAAAQEGVRSADCERCGEAVDVALLTDPECPHCDAAVSDVRPTGGIFRTTATLVAAAQLESGEQ